MKKMVDELKERKELIVFGVLLIGLFISFITISNNFVGGTIPVIDDPITEPRDDEPKDEEDPVIEYMQLPIKNITYSISKEYFDLNYPSNNIDAIFDLGNGTSIESNGMSFSEENDTIFDIYSVYSGDVVEIGKSDYYGEYVVVEHKTGIKSKYYGFSTISVSLNDKVNQDTILGKSGLIDVDARNGNQIHLQVLNNDDMYMNPNDYLGKTIENLLK